MDREVVRLTQTHRRGKLVDWKAAFDNTKVCRQAYNDMASGKRHGRKFSPETGNGDVLCVHHVW